MRDVSPRMLRAFFTPDSPENIITLLKISGANLAEPIYLCDGYTKRLDALTTDDEVVYGLTSEGIDHIFLPFNFPMPSDDGADGDIAAAEDGAGKGNRIRFDAGRCHVVAERQLAPSADVVIRYGGMKERVVDHLG